MDKSINFFSYIVAGLLLPLILLSSPAVSQQFEGTITYVKTTLDDTSYFAYHIKGLKVRVDGLSDDFSLLNSVILDLEEGTKTAIDVSRQLYSRIQPYRQPVVEGIQVNAERQNTKTVAGYQCEQWLLMDQSNNTVLTYWMADLNYPYFQQLLELKGASDRISSYFISFTPPNGFVPLAAVERSLLRTERSRIEAISVEEKTLEDSLFEIPDNYDFFENK